MKSSDAPDPPNPLVTTSAQTRANRDLFDFALGQSRVNQSSPFGTQSWTSTPFFDEGRYQEALTRWQNSADSYKNSGEYQAAKPIESDFTTNRWNYSTQLSPEMQTLFDRNVQSQLGQSELLDTLTQRVGETAGRPLDLSSLPALQGGIQAPELSQLEVADFLRGLAGNTSSDAYSQEVADAAYRRQTEYLEPQREQELRALEARLGEQGFVPGTPGYDQAMENFMDSNARRFSDARNSSILQGYSQGNTERGLAQQLASLLASTQGNQFQQNQASAVFGNQARDQALRELLTLRNQPLNELSAFRSGTGVQMPNAPAQYSVPSIAPVDIIGAQQQGYQNELAGYNADVATKNMNLQTLLTLGGLAGGAGLFNGLFGGGAGAGAVGGSGLSIPPGFTW